MRAQSEHDSGPGFYSRATVLEKTTWSNTTLWREIRAGRFPEPVQLSRARVGWDREAVNGWVNEKLGRPANAAS